MKNLKLITEETVAVFGPFHDNKVNKRGGLWYSRILLKMGGCILKLVGSDELSKICQSSDINEDFLNPVLNLQHVISDK